MNQLKAYQPVHQAISTGEQEQRLKDDIPAGSKGLVCHAINNSFVETGCYIFLVLGRISGSKPIFLHHIH